jgi:hypothetical protein
MVGFGLATARLNHPLCFKQSRRSGNYILNMLYLGVYTVLMC